MHPLVDARRPTRIGARIAGMALAALVAAAAHAIDPTKPPPKLPAPGDTSRTQPVRPTFAAGSAFEAALKTNATGIYRLGTSSFGARGSATTFALVHAGQIKQVQSKRGAQWLPKQQGSSGGLPVSGPMFDQLIQIAGAVDRNANQLPAAKREQFLCVAKLKTSACPSSPGGSLPPEVVPIDNACPTGYGLQTKRGPTGKSVKVCVLLTRNFRHEPDGVAPVVAALRATLHWLVPAAHARDCGPIGCMTYFSFGEIGAFRFRFEFNEQGNYWGFNGFGIVAIFILPEHEVTEESGG